MWYLYHAIYMQPKAPPPPPTVSFFQRFCSTFSYRTLVVHVSQGLHLLEKWRDFCMMMPRHFLKWWIEDAEFQVIVISKLQFYIFSTWFTLLSISANFCWPILENFTILQYCKRANIILRKRKYINFEIGIFSSINNNKHLFLRLTKEKYVEIKQFNF